MLSTQSAKRMNNRTREEMLMTHEKSAVSVNFLTLASINAVVGTEALDSRVEDSGLLSKVDVRVQCSVVLDVLLW